MSWSPAGPALLFCPADRPDRFTKAANTADMVILDIEDGVAQADKPRARRALRDTLLDPSRTIVRVNPIGGTDHELDLEALASTPYDVLLLAKTESAEHVASLPHHRVIALCETPLGVVHAGSIAACPSTVALMWGAEDLIAALGGRSSRGGDGRYRDVARHARSQVLLAASARGKPALDAVHLDLADLDGLREEAVDAAASGFAATACLHPKQVAVVRDAYRPDERQIGWAREVLALAAGSPGAFLFEGRMVDAVVLRHAQRILDQLRVEP